MRIDWRKHRGGRASICAWPLVNLRTVWWGYTERPPPTTMQKASGAVIDDACTVFDDGAVLLFGELSSLSLTMRVSSYFWCMHTVDDREQAPRLFRCIHFAYSGRVEMSAGEKHDFVKEKLLEWGCEALHPVFKCKFNHFYFVKLCILNFVKWHLKVGYK